MYLELPAGEAFVVDDGRGLVHGQQVVDGVEIDHGAPHDALARLLRERVRGARVSGVDVPVCVCLFGLSWFVCFVWLVCFVILLVGWAG